MAFKSRAYLHIVTLERCSMNKLKIVISLLRINQWYKNIVIFLAVVFSLKFFSVEDLLLTVLGFIAICLVSSAGYVRNDIKDLESDKQHQQKKNRPLPSGLITVLQAKGIFILLLVSGLGLAFFLKWEFGVMATLLIINTEVYSNWLKKIIFLDIFSISGNFIIRAISGVILISSVFSPWLILGIFFMALFLASVKRRNEFETMKESAKKLREVLNDYTELTLNSLILISSVLIITTYSLYTMNSVVNDWRLVITVPIVVYIVFRLIHQTMKEQEKVISDNILKDKGTAVAIVVYIGITLYLLYLVPAKYFVG